MARNSTCERQLVRAAGDAAFRVLPPMVRLLMLEILAFAAAAPEKGRLRFLGPVSAALSRLLSIPETEVETGLETLAQLGWVEEDAETHSLWVSAARAAAARVEAARANGIRGGRPRKGETPEQYQARKAREREQAMRQQHFMMPIAGGARAETQETEAEPNAESSRAVLPTTSLSIEGSGGSTAREETDVVFLAAELARAARVEGRRFDEAPVRAWLVAGATPELLRQAVRQVAGRATYAPERVNGWGYFEPRVQELLAAQKPRAGSAGEGAFAPMTQAERDAAQAREYLDMVSGAVPSTEQERERKASFLREYAKGAWELVTREMARAAA